MPKLNGSKLAAAAVMVLLVAGIVRAVADQMTARRDAITSACRNELKSSGQTVAAVKNKYSTPELKLCKCADVTPGGVGEVVVRGTFRPGTKFLFSSDEVQVVKESLTPGQPESEYHATIKAAPGSLPELVSVQSFEPQLCRGIYAPAVYIGGKYEWNFTADNGWKIQLRQTQAPTCKQGGTAAVYRAEFFKPHETSAFESPEVRVSCHNGACDGTLEEGAGETAQNQKMLSALQNQSPEEKEQSDKRVKELQAQMAQLQDKMKNFASLSPKEQQDLMAKVGDISKQMAEAMMPKGLAQAQHEGEEQKAEFGCHSMSFHLKGNALEGSMSCGKKVGSEGELKLQGTTKLAG